VLLCKCCFGREGSGFKARPSEGEVEVEERIKNNNNRLTIRGQYQALGGIHSDDRKSRSQDREPGDTVPERGKGRSCQDRCRDRRAPAQAISGRDWSDEIAISGSAEGTA
jgi:hypothetical protein